MANLTDGKQGADDPNILPPLGRRFLWADNPAAVSLAIKCLAALCVLLFLLDFVIHRHGHFSVEALYGFYGLAGFAAFTVIVISAKLLRMIIGRDEAYYAPRAVDHEDYPDEGLEIKSHSDVSSVTSEAKS